MGIVCCRTKDPFSDHDFFSEPFEDDEKEETAQSVCISRDFRGRMVVNDYVLREIIGKGSFGEVRKAKSRLNSEFVAVKIIDKVMLKKKKVFIKQRMSDMYQCIKREIEILRKLKHRNVIRLVEVINDPKCRKVFIGRI
jgi:serine/threonine protein kinase